MEGMGARALRTARIADTRGFCFHHEDMARWLHGGPAESESVLRAAEEAPGLTVMDGFIALRGREPLVAVSRARRESYHRLKGDGESIARDFAHRLVSDCPFVKAVALGGSHASGGAVPGDDVDVNILVEDRTKFIVYSLALLRAARYSFSREARAIALERLGPLPKVVCINTVYEESQVHPFARRDEQVAFEMLMSRPVYGAETLRGVVESNPWLLEHFPQIEENFTGGGYRHELEVSRLGKAMGSLNGTRDIVDALGFSFARIAHGLVDLTRMRDPEAVERRRFLRAAKYPYDVLDRVEARR